VVFRPAPQPHGGAVDRFLAERSKALSLEGVRPESHFAAEKERLEAVVGGAREDHAAEDLEAFLACQRGLDRQPPEKPVALVEQRELRLLDAPGGARPRCGVTEPLRDRARPEPSRKLALQGAEIIFMPIAYATYGNDNYRVSIWDLPLQARAFDNGVFVVAANRVGDENGRRHIGLSAIVNPLGGRIMKQATMDGPELLVAEIDLDDVDKARRSLPWWRDRRPDLYGNLDPA